MGLWIWNFWRAKKDTDGNYEYGKSVVFNGSQQWKKEAKSDLDFLESEKKSDEIGYLNLYGNFYY